MGTAHAICCFSTLHSWCPPHGLCITTASQLFHSQMYIIVPATPEAKRIPSSAMVPRDTSRTPSLPASAMMACTCITVLELCVLSSMRAQLTLHVCRAAAWRWRSADDRADPTKKGLYTQKSFASPVAGAPWRPSRQSHASCCGAQSRSGASLAAATCWTARQGAAGADRTTTRLTRPADVLCATYHSVVFMLHDHPIFSSPVAWQRVWRVHACGGRTH